MSSILYISDSTIDTKGFVYREGGSIESQTESRIVLKVYGKVSNELKAGIKAIGGYWDDLFDAWNLPGNAFPIVGSILQKLDAKHQIREFELPKMYKSRDAAKESYMFSKYTRILQALKREEDRLAVDVHRYETGRKWIGEDGKEDLPSGTEKYSQMPTAEGKTALEYQIEKAFHERYMAIKKTREELDQINRELRMLETEALCNCS